MNNHLIDFCNVSYSYEDEQTEENTVIKNINLKIDRGEFVVILGHNGSGKSTIAKLSNGIFLPTAGCVYVDGVDTSDITREFEIRKKIGVVFQNPDNQIVASIVEEDVAFGPENLGLPSDEIRRRVDDALKTVGIYDYRLHETHRLSGGQKQRVAIAGIIAMQPDCIVLDEPTAMLDPSGRKDVHDTIHKLNKEFGKTIVLITHFMEEAVDADRVIVINDGNIITEGTPESVFSESELLFKNGLDIPDITKLGYMLKHHPAFNEVILTEDDFIDKISSVLKN